MNAFQILEMARQSVQHIRTARELVTRVTDAVRDGRVALNTKEQAELNKLLAEEQSETEAAGNSLRRAIEEARSKNT